MPDIDFQYIRENKKFKTNKQIKNTLMVSFAYSLLFSILLIIYLIFNIGAHPILIILSLFAFISIIFYTIRFIKQLKFEEFKTKGTPEEVSSEITNFLKSKNIDFEFDTDKNVIIIKGRKLYSSPKTYEIVYILIAKNSILINNMIKGSVIINTGWSYPNKKQYKVLKMNIKSLLVN